MDIPLTPCVVEGDIDICGKIISCWSHSKENARKMNILCNKVKEFINNGVSINEISRLSHNIYEKYHSSGKNLLVAFKETNLNKKSLNIKKSINVY